MSIQSRHNFRKILKFGVVGVLNTFVGYSAILGALWFGFGDISANAIGYAFGLVLSFLLNSRWTFRGMAVADVRLVVKYLIAFVFSYAVNLAVVIGLRSSSLMDSWEIHLTGIGIYTLVFYIVSDKFVFEKRLIVSYEDYNNIKIKNRSFRDGE